MGMGKLSTAHRYMYVHVLLFMYFAQYVHMCVMYVHAYISMYACSCDMLAELLESPDLFMMQVEMDAYTLTKKV